MNRISIEYMDITTAQVDAIVNAANRNLAHGGGVCGAIFMAAGAAALQQACNAVAPCETGRAAITSGFRLKAKYIIHAVGPVWHGGHQNEAALLRSTYQDSLRLAVENNCKTIAFPLISAGIFGYSLAEAWQVALQACADFLAESAADIRIIFAVIDNEIKDIGNAVLQNLQIG